MLGFRKRSRGDIPTPLPGSVNITVDSDGLFVVKKEDGTFVAPEELVASLTTLVGTKADASTAATQAALTTAINSLTTLINGKQDASSAATTSALESAVATINAALATKQNAATAATDSELTTAIAGVNASLTTAIAELQEALATKQSAATAATDTELASGLATKQSISGKGVAGGYPELDGSGHVPPSQMPVGALTYKGTWNAATNTPTLSDATGSVGQQYAITVDGTRNLGSGSVEYKAGAVLQHNGSIWQQIASPDAVASVFGRKGTVVPASGDYSIGQITGAGTAAAKDSGAAGSAGKVLDADDPVLPSSAQKNAMAGNDGTPGSGNPYLTKQSLGASGAAGKALKADDPTTTDPRTPKSHAASHVAAGADPLALSAAQILDLGSAALAEVGIDVPTFTDARLEALKLRGVIAVVYGEDASVARPNSGFIVVWVGKVGVTPVNATKYDLTVQSPVWE